MITAATAVRSWAEWIEEKHRLPKELQEYEVLRCIAPGGFRYFYENYTWIEDQQHGVMQAEFWPAHAEAIDALETEQFIIILKARQIGMSWLLGASYPIWLTQFNPSKLAMMFSWRDDEAAELVRKARFVWSRLPDWMKAELSKDNALELNFKGLDSRILAFPSSPDAGSSYSASYVVSDEHAKQQYAKQQYAAIRPTIEHGGQFVAVSTARGGGTFHNRVWKGAKSRTNGFKPLFFPYSARPGRDQAWWERTRNSWEEGDEQFFQEYPRTPEEAVQFSVPRYFKPEHLTVEAELSDPLTPPFSEKMLDSLVRLRAAPETLGCRVYREPNRDRKYAIGADVSEGSGGDRQAAVVIDLETGDEVAVLHGMWPTAEFAELLFKLAWAYRAILAVERNNHGGTVLYILQRKITEYQRDGKRVPFRLHYDRPTLNKITGAVKPGQPGWLTTSRTKPVMYDMLSSAIRTHSVRVASDAILQEALMVVQDPDTGKIGAEPGYHDDLVVALGIANMMRSIYGAQRGMQRQTPYSLGRTRPPQVRRGRRSHLAQQGAVLPVVYRQPRKPSPLQQINSKTPGGVATW